MTFPIAVHLLVLVLLGETGAQEDPLLPFTEHLDSDQLVTLKWGFDNIRGNITFELCVNTTGWISFGLSPNGGMTGADIVIGGVNSDGHYLGDFRAVGHGTPALDQKQSYSLLSLTEADGQTTMRFERSIMSCDTDNHPLTVFAMALHTHLAGRKVRVGNLRDGKQLGFMALDEHYDFEFQKVTHLGTTKTLKKGDSLLVECTYDTVKRAGLTQGGMSTQEEMCLAFLYYYPATNLSNCLSFPYMEALVTKLGASDLNEVYVMLSKKTWDEQAVEEYERTLKDIPQYVTVDNEYWSSTAIKDMMESPTASCEKTPPPPNTSNLVRMSWILLPLVGVVTCALVLAPFQFKVAFHHYHL